MKKLTASLAILFIFVAFAPVSSAGSSARRVVGYNQCGDPVYATWRVVAYQRCGRPIYNWVRDSRTSTRCTRPGRCNHHGYARSSSCSSNRHTATRSVRSRSGSSIYFRVSPRVTIRSSRSSYRRAPVRSSSRQRSSRSCR